MLYMYVVRKFKKRISMIRILLFFVGMEAWKDLFVPPPVLRALKENGFVDPTPIQVQVLPPAVRDKLDILGAAETVSSGNR